MSGFNPVDEIGLIVADAVPELLSTGTPGRRLEVNFDFRGRRYRGFLMRRAGGTPYAASTAAARDGARRTAPGTQTALIPVTGYRFS